MRGFLLALFVVCVYGVTVLNDGSDALVYPLAWSCGWEVAQTNKTSPPTAAPGDSNHLVQSFTLNAWGGISYCSRPCAGVSGVNTSSPSAQYSAISLWIYGVTTAHLFRGHLERMGVQESDHVFFSTVPGVWNQLYLEFQTLRIGLVERFVLQSYRGGANPMPEVYMDNVILETAPYRCDPLAQFFAGGVVSPAQLITAVSFNYTAVAPPSPAPGAVSSAALVARLGNNGVMEVAFPPIPNAQAGSFITGFRFWAFGAMGGVIQTFLNTSQGPASWSRDSYLANSVWREVRVTFNTYPVAGNVSGLRLRVTSNSTVFMDQFTFTTSQALPVCVEGLVYVPNYLCSTFNTTSLPASLVGSGLGRCTQRYNDTQWCRDWQPFWSSNVVQNGQAQLQFGSFWTLISGSFADNDLGMGVRAQGVEVTPARRTQRIDLLAGGFSAAYLDQGPAVLVKVRLRPTPTNVSGALDVYRYQIFFLNAANVSLVIKSDSINVVGPYLVNFTVRDGLSGLRYIVYEDQGFDTANSAGPIIENVVLLLNIDECDASNGGCDTRRPCFDQLTPPAICGACVPGYLEGPGGTCIASNPCASSVVCPSRSTCNLDVSGNTTCICSAGLLMNQSGACVDIDECVAGNITNGNCATNMRCFNVDAATSSAPVCLPYPMNCSLALGNNAPSCTPWIIPNNLGGQVLTLNFSAPPVVQKVSFGQFLCANVTVNGTFVSCVLPAGAIGRMQVLVVSLCGSTCLTSNDIYTLEAGSFRFPDPVITSGSLRLLSQSSGTPTLVSNTSFGEVIAFAGSNFLAGSQTNALAVYKIEMRSPNETDPLYCVPQSSTQTNLTICRTPAGFGVDYVFRIIFDGVSLVNGTDTYSYPISPRISTIRGCPRNNSAGTADCPTNGGTIITITGSYFAPAVVVTVGGNNCAIQSVVGSTTIYCSLPPLTGLAIVTVSLGSLFSLPASLVTYAPPVIRAISGCPSQEGNLSTLDCARNGTSILTLQGQDFGINPPLILVGQIACTNVTIDSLGSQVTCKIPEGMNTDVGVLFVQAGGFQAAPPYPSLSFYQCPPGFSSATIVCQPCQAGTFTQSAGLPVCELCEAGFVSNASASRCSACTPGTFAQEGWPDCVACSAGRYSPASGQSDCTDCSSGYFNNLTRQTTCLACSQGEFQTYAGMSSCSLCLPGTFANFFGYKLCASCPKGKYTTTRGTVDCQSCPPGTSQPSTAATDCEVCVAGTYAASSSSSTCTACEAGSYSVTSATSCLLCNPGFVQPRPGSALCTPCAPGMEAALSGQSECSFCLAGRYAVGDPNGTIYCESCEPGSYQPNFGQALCLLCAAGQVNARDFKSCTQCQAGRYSASPGSSLCHVCSPGSIPDSLSISCICPLGTFARIISDGVISCDDCPLGAVCDRPGITFESLETEAGFWRPNEQSLTFYRCKVPQMCLGGRNSSCDGYRTGPVCGICLEGYAAGGPDKSCALCPAENVAWGYTVLIFLALLLVMIICLYIVLRLLNLQQIKLIQYARQLDEANTQKMQQTLDAYTPKDDYFVGLRKELHPDQAPIEEEPKETGPATPSIKSLLVLFDSLAASKAIALTEHTFQRAPNFIYKCKILLGFFQVASIMPLNGVVSWPKYWSQFISVFAFFNFDFVPWQTLGCAASVNFLQKAIIVGCIPIASVIVIALVVYSSTMCNREAGLEIQMARQQAQERAWSQFVKLVLFTVFLLYPFTSKVTLGVYNCVTVEGVSYLSADFSVICAGGDYWTYAGFNFLFVLMYPIGLPVAYLFLLKSIRGQLRDPHTVLLYGFLYDAYRPECWFWEVLDMLHKLLLTSALLFLPVNLILGACMLTVTFYLMGLLLAHPYIRKGDDRFHLLVQCNLYFLALVGLILSTVEDPYASTNYSPESLQTLLSLLLISINIGLFVGFFIIAGRNLWKIYKNARPRKAKSSELAPETTIPRHSDTTSTAPRESEMSS